MSKPLQNLSDDQTPLMKQYWDLKTQAADSLLLFRMGDFYELFGEDAVCAAAILEITLTSRDKNKPNPMPMAGVPHHSVQGYIQKLLKAGKKVAIGEQIEDPESVKGSGKIVRREIVRILTPAVQFDAEGAEANYLATVVQMDSRTWVLACLDPSTGETLVSNGIDSQTLASELKRFPVRHFLKIGVETDSSMLALSDSILVECLPKNYLSLERAGEILKLHYDVQNLGAFLNHESAILALGILVSYTLRTQQQETLAHLRVPEPLQKPQTLILGPNTAQHLDLPDLYLLVNRTRSTLGARLLKRWMMAPLLSVSEISMRQEAVRELSLRWSKMGDRLTSVLSQVYDLERICGRINTQLANPRDSLALGQSLHCLKNLENSLQDCQSPTFLEIQKKISHLSKILTPLTEKILTQQKEEAPFTSREGGIFKTGTTPDLDRLISLTEDGQKWLIDLESRERTLTGIPSLKVRYNRVFGYYIEITQTHLKNVPPHYQRKQTMVGAERFFTEELKKFEEEILTASIKQKSLEQELFNQLIQEIQKQTASIMEAAQVIAEVDTLSSLALLARQPGWCFPEISETLEFEIQAGRHPMVDQAQGGSFVPNDISLSPETRLILLITGPNMGGKSTVMRQTALMVILGQMGAPIPAERAKWGSVSSVYTRIGAQDAIAKGQSTFMVEMSELAHILHYADHRSLIILDEIGRGTSTYDGMSVAWATLEWICTRIQARTFFATHYHELVRLATTLPLLANSHMAVESDKNLEKSSLRFLYQLREGPTNESFGIHVAQLAGLPKPVITRAWKILQELESQSQQRNSGQKQLSLFQTPTDSLPPPLLRTVPREPEIRYIPHPLVEQIQQMNLDQMSPIDALDLLFQMKKSYFSDGINLPAPGHL